MTDIKEPKPLSDKELKAQEKTAAKLEKRIQSETVKFNEKIKKLGEKAGISIQTEVHIIIK